MANQPQQTQLSLVAACATSIALLLPACGSLDLEPGSEGLLQGMLSGRRGPRPADAARMAIDPYNANNRTVGTLALANAYFAGGEPYVALFADNIDDEDAGVRAAACRGLANHGEASHAPLLTKLLKDPDAGVRLEATRGLQRLHNADAVLPLIALLDPAKEPETPIRSEAAIALGQYRENRVVRALIAALADPQLSVNKAAEQSLFTLTGQTLGQDRAAWSTWLSDHSEQTFASAHEYTFPIFSRKKKLFEYLPLVPPPPNETASVPAGYPR